MSNETPTPEQLTRRQRPVEAGSCAHGMVSECATKFTKIESDVNHIAGRVRHVEAVLHGAGEDGRGGLVSEFNKINTKLNLLIGFIILLCGLSYPKLLLAFKELVVK